MGFSNVQDRKFAFCPRLAEYSLDNLIVQCDDCERFFAACCPDDSLGGDMYDEDKVACHHSQLVFTDGACPGNGGDNARAGLGITLGGDELSWGIRVDDEVDPGALRTNQRAELLAAIEGLKRLHQLNVDLGHHARLKVHQRSSPTYIVATDSKYVVEGMTEWFPSWKKRGWRTADGKRPANLDLFVKLDEYTAKLEKERIEVGFWYIPRAYNKKADTLAKRAACS